MSAVNTDSFSLKASQCISAFCRSLSDTHLVNFVHDITFGQGEISILTTQPEMSLYYYENKIPVVCTDESGRTLAEGIYLDKVLAGYHKEYTPLMTLLHKVAKGKGINYGQHAMHFSVREDDCQHLYTVFFDLSEHDFLHYVINNGGFLQDMIDRYNAFAKDIILEAKSAENRAVLPSSALQTSTERISVVHRHTGLPIHLSMQQGLCLKYLMQGNSAKGIARLMDLSPRTVEYYLSILRQQLGCRSSNALILAYADQVKISSLS